MKNKKLIASCMLALSLVGCTGLEAGNGAYTAGGAAGGAALGAIAGQVIGKDTKGTLIGGVTFASDSANITSSFYSALNGIAQSLNNYPETRIQVNGYTDSTGNDAHNQELSQRRANAVAQYLVAQGVSSSRIVANGFGSSNPIASNSTQEGRLQNRRVEIKILPAQ